MKKAICLLLAIIFILGVTACTNDNNQTTGQSATKLDYYTTIKEQGDNVVFDMTIEEFVSSFNQAVMLMKYTRGVEITSLETNDFEKIGTGTSWFNPIENERWSALLDDNNNLVVGVDNSGIASVMLMSPSKTEIVLSQFICVIQAVTQKFNDDNFTDEEAFDIADELIEKMGTANNAAAIYRKGIVFYFRPLENPDVWVFGAEAVTEEQYNQTIGTE